DALDATVSADLLGAPSSRLVIELRPKAGVPKRCSRCGDIVVEVHDVTPRRVRDVPVFDHETWLLVPRARLQCPRCGPTVEAVPWLDRYQRMTTRLAEKIARLAQVLPIKHVAEWFGVHWATVKQIDQRALAARLGPVDLTGVRQIAIDEFALHRGRDYATVVADVRTRRVLWIGPRPRRRDARAILRAARADGLCRARGRRRRSLAAVAQSGQDALPPRGDRLRPVSRRGALCDGGARPGAQR